MIIIVTIITIFIIIVNTCDYLLTDMTRDGLEADHKTVSLLLKLHGKACQLNNTPDQIKEMENFVDLIMKGGYKGHPKVNMNETILR
jgi:hypothetical protein